MRRIFLMAAACLALWGAWRPNAWGSDIVKFKDQTTILAEYDDNVFKTVSDVKGDFLARIYSDSHLYIFATPTNTFSIDYTLGVKKYIHLSEEDTLINQIGLRYLNTWIPSTYFGGEGQLKFRNVRDGDENYNKLILKAFAGHYFSKGVSGEVFSSYTRFDFQPYNFYDYWSQDYGIEFKKAYSHETAFTVHYIYEQKYFPFLAFKSIPTANGEIFLVEKNDLRKDTMHDIGFSVASTPFVLLNFGYDLQINDSNSYGDAFYNHRFRLTASKAITDAFNLHLYAIANVFKSYQKVLIPHSYSIEEDDENFNQVLVKANYKLKDWLWLEARYGRFWSQYAIRQFNFIKDTYSVGVTMTW